jgi:hypothetical protein
MKLFDIKNGNDKKLTAASLSKQAAGLHART